MVSSDTVDIMVKAAVAAAAEKGVTAAQLRVESAANARRTTATEGLLLRPLSYANHFSLLAAAFAPGSRPIITVFDSLPRYSNEARAAALDNAMGYAVEDRDWSLVDSGPQRTNECAFRTARSVGAAIFLHARQALGQKRLRLHLSDAWTFADAHSWTRPAAMAPIIAQRTADVRAATAAVEAVATSHAAIFSPPASVRATAAHLNNADCNTHSCDQRLMEPSAHAPVPFGPQQRCTAHRQAKKGGARCTSLCLPGHAMCAMHLQLQHADRFSQCSFIGPRGRCSHHPARGLSSCPFHTPPAVVDTWASHLLDATTQVPAVRSSKTTADVTADLAPMLHAYEALNDPDTELDLLTDAMMMSYDHTWRATDPPSTSGSMTLGQLRMHLGSPSSPAHPLSTMYLADATKQGHTRVINRLSTAPKDFDNWPVVKAILEMAARQRKEKKTRWSTLLRHLAETQGALAALPVSQGKQPVLLARNPEWIAAVKGVAVKARSERPGIPVAITALQVDEAIQREPQPLVKLCLALAWLLCGRTGDIRQLHDDDIAMEGDSLTVTYRRGKTVARRGPYSVHTTIPTGWRSIFTDQALFSQLHRIQPKDMLVALRRVDPRLENRSIRRGALQQLANSGLTVEELLAFSGHASAAMLDRYLNWGSIGSLKRTKMLKAAVALDPQPQLPQGAGYKPLRLSPVNRSGRFSEAHPRWLQYQGAEAPPVEELPVHDGHTSVDPASLPLASKDVAAAINTKKALSYDDVPAPLHKLSSSSFSYLDSRAKYERLRSIAPSGKRLRRHGQCGLLLTDIEIQIRLRKYEIEQQRDEIQAWCRVFSIPEWHKRPPRRRHIAEPLCNDFFVDTPTVVYPSRWERSRTIAQFAGGWALQLDFVSYFDQFALHEAVRPFFGIDWSHLTVPADWPYGEQGRMTVLPMGFRPAAQIAQCMTWLICCAAAKYSGPSLRVITYLDNILIIGFDAKAVVRARDAIVRRAEEVGAVIDPADIDASPTQEFDFLGDHFDLRGCPSSPTRVLTSLTEKTQLKLRALLDNEGRVRSSMTRRQLAALVGLCAFATGAGIPANDMYRWHRPLAFYRATVSGQGRIDWNTVIDLPPTVSSAFADWVSSLLQNHPRPIDPNPAPPTTDIIFTDASAVGWGATHWDTSTGIVRSYSGSWSREDWQRWNLHSSVHSEPLGMTRALCRIIAPAKHRSVILYTDHSPLLDAVPSSCARTDSYWCLQKHVREFQAAGSHIIIRFVPGSLNPADTASRGKEQATWDALLPTILEYHKQCEDQQKGHGMEYGMRSDKPEWYATAEKPVRPLLGSSWSSARKQTTTEYGVLVNVQG
jgi:integrase